MAQSRWRGTVVFCALFATACSSTNTAALPTVGSESFGAAGSARSAPRADIDINGLVVVATATGGRTAADDPNQAGADDADGADENGAGGEAGTGGTASNAGQHCFVTGGFNDVAAGAKVTVTSADGATLATLLLSAGVYDDSGSCDFEFSGTVPARRGPYLIALAGRPGEHFSEADVANPILTLG